MKIYRSRAPLRLGLAGGGSDVSPYCERYGGHVLNATINHYANCTIEPSLTTQIEFLALDANVTESHAAATRLDTSSGLALHRAVYNYVVEKYNDNIPLALRMSTFCAVPPGSGLGSSSALCVAMIQAYCEWLSLPLGEYDVAYAAYLVERRHLKQTGGRQDQYASAFGGINFINFGADDRVIVNPLRVKDWILREFELSIVLFYSNITRYSSTIIDSQIQLVETGDRDAINATHGIKEGALTMKDLLLKGKINEIAEVFNRSWMAKKQLAGGITNTYLDGLIDAAFDAGALSAKVSGAGGGGFLMFMVDFSNRLKLEKALSLFEGKVCPFLFSNHGVESWAVRQ